MGWSRPRAPTSFKKNLFFSIKARLPFKYFIIKTQIENLIVCGFRCKNEERNSNEKLCFKEGFLKFNIFNFDIVQAKQKIEKSRKNYYV